MAPSIVCTVHKRMLSLQTNYFYWFTESYAVEMQNCILLHAQPAKTGEQPAHLHSLFTVLVDAMDSKNQSS